MLQAAGEREGEVFFWDCALGNDPDRAIHPVSSSFEEFLESLTEWSGESS